METQLERQFICIFHLLIFAVNVFKTRCSSRSKSEMTEVTPAAVQRLELRFYFSFPPPTNVFSYFHAQTAVLCGGNELKGGRAMIAEEAF